MSRLYQKRLVLKAMVTEYTGAMPHGHLHPISSLIREANRIFYDMGFTFAEGPLLEDEWHNFDALNVPKDHPARDMQDTFFIKDEPGMVLRTHTSNVQIRYMESQMKKNMLPPYRIIVPGKVFRNEATDMTHEAEFFQMEGLVVGTDVTLAQLKGTLARFFAELFKARRSRSVFGRASFLLPNRRSKSTCGSWVSRCPRSYATNGSR